RTLHDIAYPAVAPFNQPLLSNYSTTVEYDTNDALAAKTSEKEVVSKLSERRASIKHSAGRSHGRCVLEQRRFHAFATLCVMNHWPAVVLSPVDDVDFISSAGPVETRRTVLSFKQSVSPWLPVDTLRVAIPVAP